MVRSRLHTCIPTKAIAIVGIAALVALPLTPATPETQSPSPPTVSQDVRLAAATVPPGGLITSFLGNQVIYCSIICPLLIQTAVTAVATTLQTPGAFLSALQSGDLWKAIGITAASVTGPTNTAAQEAIVADGTLVAPRALNAFEVAVVGLLNVVPAAAGGLPGIAGALQTARQDTFTALNLPIVPNPTPTVAPRGVMQVAVVAAINVVAAIIFPAFNHVLSAVFEVPDAVAQELAATGDPVRAVAAGVSTAVRQLTAAGTVIAEAIVTASSDVRTAVEQSHPANQVTQSQNSATTATPPPDRDVVAPTPRSTTTTKNADDVVSAHPLREVSARPSRTVRDVAEKDVAEKDTVEKDTVEKDTVEKDTVEKDVAEKDVAEQDTERDRADRADGPESSPGGAEG